MLNGVNRLTMYLFRTDFLPYLAEQISIEFYTLSRLFRIAGPKTLDILHVGHRSPQFPNLNNT